MLVTPHLLKKIKIDSEAKTKIALTPQQDKHGNTYYLGKWQGPLLLDLSCGVSFMAFVSDDGAEELHISLRDPRKPPRKGGRQVTMLNDGTMKIPLRAANDKYDQTFYVGELTGSLFMPIHMGTFFILFNSIEGKEELQISQLQHIKEEDEEFEAIEDKIDNE